jgi:hypothetical protein
MDGNIQFGINQANTPLNDFEMSKDALEALEDTI